MNGGTCNDDSADFTFGDFPGYDGQSEGTWQHNKMLYHMYAGIEEAKTFADNRGHNEASQDSQMTMDLLTGITSLVDFGANTDISDHYKMSKTAIGSYLDDGSNDFDGAVTTNLVDSVLKGSDSVGGLVNFTNALPGFVKTTLIDNNDICNKWACDKTLLNEAIGTQLTTVLAGHAYDGSLEDVLQWQGNYNAHEALPGMKISYNYMRSSEVFDDSTDEMRKALKNAKLDAADYRHATNGFRHDYDEAAQYASEAGIESIKTFKASNQGKTGVSSYTTAVEKAYGWSQESASSFNDLWEHEHISTMNSAAVVWANAMESDSFWNDEVYNAMVKIKSSVNDMVSVWSDYKTGGMAGRSLETLAGDVSATGSTAEGTCTVQGGCAGACGKNMGAHSIQGVTGCRGPTYGCSGAGIDDLFAFTTPLHFWASHKCAGTPMYTPGETNVVGGVFFSQTLGGFESFAAWMPPTYCEMSKKYFSAGTLPTQLTSGVKYDTIIMLHGWSGHCDFIDSIALALSEIVKACTGTNHYSGCGTPGTGAMGAVGGFLVVAPEDGSTPMGTKTWYYDSEFTGRHTYFIMDEIPAMIEYTTNCYARARGMFGFSQGGVGSLMFTLNKNGFPAIAAFNGSVMPNDCFYNNECHQECGVDFVMCEILWTTIHVAFFPYIVVKAGYPVSTEGPYDPMAQGVCKEMYDANRANCVFYTHAGQDFTHLGRTVSTPSGGMKRLLLGAEPTKTVSTGAEPTKTVSTGAQQLWQYVAVAASGSSGALGDTGIKRFHCNSSSNEGDPTMIWDCHYAQVKWTNASGAVSDTYFYLKPKFFVMSVQHFWPSHNIITNKADATQCNLFMQKVPLFNLWMNPYGYATGTAQNVLISCDKNDEFGIHDVTEIFVQMLSSQLISGFSGYWIYDVPYSEIEYDSNNELVKTVLCAGRNDDGELSQSDCEHSGKTSGRTSDNQFMGNGHFYDAHDVMLTIEWFSDAFRTWGKFPDSFPDGYPGNTENGTPAFDEFGIRSIWAPTTAKGMEMCFASSLNMAASYVDSDDKSITIPGSADPSNTICNSFVFPPMKIALGDTGGIIEDALRFGSLHADLDGYAADKCKGGDANCEKFVYKCWINKSSYSFRGSYFKSFRYLLKDCSPFKGTDGDANGTAEDAADCDFLTDSNASGAGSGTYVYKNCRAGGSCNRKNVFNFCDAAFEADA